MLAAEESSSWWEQKEGWEEVFFLSFYFFKIGKMTAFWCANKSDLVDRKTDNAELGRINGASILSTGERMGLSGFGLEHRR